MAHRPRRGPGTRQARRALGAAVGLAADRVLGEPPARLHPVVGLGAVMGVAERRWWRDGRRRGVLHAGAGVALGLLAGVTLEGLLGVGPAAAVGTEVAVAGRALAEEALAVQVALVAGDLAGARRRVSALVGRDPSDLDRDDLARAVVESVAENTVDAVVAPVLWATVAGAPGALGYRVVNTLDAMVGHPGPPYERFGWASARLDDLVAWAPARASAALVALVRPRAARAVAHAVTRDAPAHPSPNAGVAEAAFAAALGVRLGGRNRYGDRVEARPPLGQGPPPGPADIIAALRLSSDVAVALGVVATAVALAWRAT